MREQFEQKYKEIHPEDGSIAKSNGNYSVWVKQAHWWAWQARQAEIDQLKAQLNNMEACYIQLKQINNEQSEIIQGHFTARQDMQKRIDAALTEFEMFAGYLCEYQPQGGDFITETLLMHGRVLKTLRGEHE